MNDSRSGGTQSLLIITKLPYDNPMDGGAIRVSAIHRTLLVDGFRIESIIVKGRKSRASRDSKTLESPARFIKESMLPALRVLFAYLRVGSLSAIRWYSWRAAVELAHKVAAAPDSILLVEYSQLAPYAKVGPERCFLDMHNVESDLLCSYAGSTMSMARRAVARFEARGLRRVESRLAGQFLGVVCVSGHDVDRTRSLNPRFDPSSVVLAPNGFDRRLFDVGSRLSSIPTVLFIGQLGWRPNIDAVVWFTSNVWPGVLSRLPDARLLVVGREPADEVCRLDGRSGVEVHPNVPDTAPYLESAWLSVAPLLASGGTRLKILESLASGTPVVATPAGALGLEALERPGCLVIAPDAERQVKTICELLLDPRSLAPELCRELASEYEWSRTLNPLVDLIVRPTR